MSLRSGVGLVGLLGLAMTAGRCDPEVGALRVSRDASIAGSDGGDGGDAPVSFARDIRPFFARSQGPPGGCRHCHYRDRPNPEGIDASGFDLTTLGALRRGGFSSGAKIVIAGNPDGSILVQKLEGTSTDGARMPKDLPPLDPREIALIRRWIAEGARGMDDE